MDSINFTANHVKNVTIAKKCFNKYQPCRVSLVELDPANKRDVKVISDTADKWDISFTCFTIEDMLAARSNSEALEKLKVYALTKQKSGFDRMKYSDVLGVIQVKKGYEDGNKIEVLQTNPKYIKDQKNKFPAFRHIGKKLTKFVQKEYSEAPLYVHPTRFAVPFYEKLGFRSCEKPHQRNAWWINPKS